MKKELNLLPKKYKQKQATRELIYQVVQIQAITIFMCSFFIVITFYRISVDSSELDQILQNINHERFIESNRIAQALAEKQRVLSTHEDILLNYEGALGGEASINIIMSHLIYPMEVMEIGFNREAQRIVLITKTDDKAVVPIFVDNINNTGIFAGTYIINTRNTAEGVVFTIEMFLR